MSFAGLNRFPEVIEWLQEYDEVMFSAYKGSNYYAAIPMYLRDGGSIGTATMFTEEDIARGSVVHTCVHPREVFIAENRFGMVDTVFRKFEKTARQLVQEFGKEALPNNVLVNAEKFPQFKYIIWHAVWPNKDLWTPKKGNKEFRSVYVIGRDAASNNSGYSAPAETASYGDNKDVIREGGFDRNPYAVWRFRKNSDEVYGYSPASDTIVPIIKANQLGKTLLNRAQMEAQPAANIPERMRGNVRLGPNGMNYFENPQDVASYITNPGAYTVGKDREDKIDDIIMQAYNVELFTFLLKSEREKTAYEIERTESQMSTLVGPQQEQLSKEGIIPVFENVHGIEDRAGRLPPPPPIVQQYVEKYPNTQINIRMQGPLAQAQDRLLKLGPINAGLNALGAAVPLFPNILDRIDDTEMAEEMLDATGFPRRLIRSDEEVQAIREARAEAAEKQQQMEMLAGAAEAYPKVSGAPEEGSPAAAMAGAL